MSRIHYSSAIPQSAAKSDWIDISTNSAISFGLISDVNGIFTIQLSPDREHIDSSISYKTSSGTRRNEVVLILCQFGQKRLIKAFFKRSGYIFSEGLFRKI